MFMFRRADYASPGVAMCMLCVHDSDTYEHIGNGSARYQICSTMGRCYVVLEAFPVLMLSCSEQGQVHGVSEGYPPAPGFKA